MAEQPSRQFMPLMVDAKIRQRYPDLPRALPFSLLDATMAREVHNQSLERLAERGGLSPVEALALMTGQHFFKGHLNGVRFREMAVSAAVEEILRRLG